MTAWILSLLPTIREIQSVSSAYWTKTGVDKCVKYTAMERTGTRLLQKSVNLLIGEDTFQRSDLAVFVTSKHLTEGTRGDATGDTVDVDLLVFMLTTHGLIDLHLWGHFTGQTGGRGVGQTGAQ